MSTRRAWAAVAAAIAAVAAVAFVSLRFWGALGAAEISTLGWLAMGFGILFTVALAVGLMTLMFYSSRHGYDEGGSGEPGDLPAAGGRPRDSDAAPRGGRGEAL